MKSLVEKTVSYKGGSIKLSAQYNKKISNCFVYMKMKTTEKWLLNVILQKYIHEKVLNYGCNAANEMYNAMATTNGIMFVCSEKKVFPNVVNTLSYICKTKLSKKELDKVLSNSADYNKLHKDMSDVSVYITGKSIHIIRALSNADDKKMDRLGEMLANIQHKDIETATITTKERPIFKFDGSTREKLDLSLVLENMPFVFDGNDVVLLDSVCPCHYNNGYDYAQGKLKSFLVSCGSPGSPAANDKDGSKHKAKCKYILECLNAMTFIVSDLHGFSYKFSNIEDIQKGVSADSKAKIRDFMKSLCK